MNNLRNRILLTLAGLVLAVAGYATGISWGRTDYAKAGYEPSARQLHLITNRWLSPENTLNEMHIEVENLDHATRADLRLALFQAYHDSELMNADALTVLGVRRLRDGWKAWVGSCSQIGFFNYRGGTSWPRMHRYAPFLFETFVHNNLAILTMPIRKGEERGPSRAKVEAMNNLLAESRRVTTERVADCEFANVIFASPRQSLHEVDELWRNELEPFIHALPREAADKFIDLAIQTLRQTEPTNKK
jgi:hypothetical protein